MSADDASATREVNVDRFNEFFFGTLLTMAVIIATYGVVNAV